MKRTIFAILPILLIASAFQIVVSTNNKKTAPVVTPEVQRRIDATLKRFIDSNKIAGVSALIFENGKEVYFNAFGLADREANVRMDRNTIVRIFSMTKPVTG